MSRNFLVLLLMLQWLPSGHTQTRSPGVSLVQEDDQSPAELARKQKRRGDLRESLKLPVETTPANTRLLSPQEKSELRQQLREQRQDLPK